VTVRVGADLFSIAVGAGAGVGVVAAAHPPLTALSIDVVVVDAVAAAVAAHTASSTRHQQARTRICRPPLLMARHTVNGVAPVPVLDVPPASSS
jgi:hypothetical protein